MKILVIGSRDIIDNIGGIEIYLKSLYNQILLKKPNYEVSIFQVSYVKKKNIKNEKFKHEYIYVNKKIIPSFLHKLFYSYIVFFKTFFTSYNIIHINGLSCAILIPIYKIFRKNVVYTNHSNDFLFKSNYLKFIFFNFLKFCSSFANLTLSHDKNYKTKNNILLNVVSNSLFIKIKKPRIKLAKKYIMFGGRFSKDKGAERFLRLSKIFPEEKFYIIGSMPLQNYVLPNNVSFLGKFNQDEFLYMLKNAFALVSPSYHESMDMTFLEAVNLKTKVIASRIDAHERISSPNILLIDFEKINKLEILDFFKLNSDSDFKNDIISFNELSKKYIAFYENFNKK